MSQWTFTCSKSTIKIWEKYLNNVVLVSLLHISNLFLVLILFYLNSKRVLGSFFLPVFFPSPTFTSLFTKWSANIIKKSSLPRNLINIRQGFSNLFSEIKNVNQVLVNKEKTKITWRVNTKIRSLHSVRYQGPLVNRFWNGKRHCDVFHKPTSSPNKASNLILDVTLYI